MRPPWQIVISPEEAAWRSYHYLGTAPDGVLQYLELGVVCHLDGDGRLVGFGVDNGVAFIGIHDTSDYGLRRGLEFIRKQHRQVREYAQPRYDHKPRVLSAEC